MNMTVRELPSDTTLAALAVQCARAWNRAYELEDNRREGEWSKYFAAVAEAEAIDEKFARVPAESPIGLRIKYVVAMSRLPDRGGRLAARQSADRAGLFASLERDKAALRVVYLA
jgi:hypothetical protein